MKQNLTLLLFSTFFVACASANNGTNGEESAKKSDILGGVYQHHSKKPLISVSVTVYSAVTKEKVIYTNNGGFYAFNDLKAGTYRFVFEKAGYKKVTKEKVIVHPDEGMQLNIEMSAYTSFEYLPGPFHFSDFD